MLDRCRGAKVPHLRISEHLVNGVNRAAGHTTVIEDADPLVAGLGLQRVVDFGVQRNAILRTRAVALEFGALEQFRPADGIAQAHPHALARCADIDVTV